MGWLVVHFLNTEMLFCLHKNLADSPVILGWLFLLGVLS